LFDHQRVLFDATSYEVQSSVPLEIFKVFVDSLKTGTNISVTKENAGAISLLAKEFWLEDLLSECSALQMASLPDIVSALSERISKLEDQISSQPLALLAELKESIANHERQLEGLDCRLSVLEPNLRAELKQLKSPIATPTPVPPVSPSTLPSGVEFPLKKAWPPDGIISYLTRKHGGNVHDEGIVTITSKSVKSDQSEYAVRNVADLSSAYSWFLSKNKPGQWICWDFHEMRVRPTHYTIRSYRLKSWVVESSLDGKTWREIDRKRDNRDFSDGRETVSFAVSKLAECRFIRLTQTGKNHYGYDYSRSGQIDRSNELAIFAFEFFGTLLE
jgi:uncharacterized coiled-coil protein SlyX